jgi:hypothetical protein
LSDYFGTGPLCDHHIDQINDYSALNHYLDRQLIDTQCALISTECNYPAFAETGFSDRRETPHR